MDSGTSNRNQNATTFVNFNKRTTVRGYPRYLSILNISGGSRRTAALCLLRGDYFIHASFLISTRGKSATSLINSVVGAERRIHPSTAWLGLPMIVMRPSRGFVWIPYSSGRSRPKRACRQTARASGGGRLERYANGAVRGGTAAPCPLGDGGVGGLLPT